ncbi:MAG TPA: molecular chaperone DjiA, partial [Saliniramus sp.]|nr:molecular chaperone DjiA [Saliniramus sp.]
MDEGMSIWGKLGGIGIGFAIGGPLGALGGALAGHVLVDREGAVFGPPPRDVVFTTGLVALAAKMAKADGVVTKSEVAAFRRIVDVSDEDRPRVEKLFALAQQTSDGFEAYADQMATLLRDEPKLLEDVLDGLFHIAKADGAIHAREFAYLNTVATRFGFSDIEFERISARHVRVADDPYLVLGIEREKSNEEIRRHYRRLVADNHPDREIARGLPPEAVRIATQRLAAINAAYDRIALERGM